jgi:sigma-B regulation protein RsbU (phosphoserine phosphatase)
MTANLGLGTHSDIDSDSVPVHRLVCSEVWGGNNVVDLTVEVPGFVGWVYSRPLYPATTGGDVYYLVVCSEGLLSRIVLADVAGHGQGVSATAATLRELLRKHMNAFDQSVLMQEINEAFRRVDNPEDVQYATAAVFGYFHKTGELIFTNAGHPRALWYHARENTWNWLHDETPYRQTTIEGVPLGLIAGTEYSQSAVRLGQGDLLVLYTDGITESTNQAGKELGYDGLLRLAKSLPLQNVNSPSVAGQALLLGVRDFRGESQIFDDESLVVLQQTVENMASFAP